MAIYFHNKFEQLEKLASNQREPMFKVNVDGIRILEILWEEFREYFAKTFEYFGAYPEDYILIGSPGDFDSLNVRNVTRQIRNGRVSGIVFFGYNDGGVFSITSQAEEFQNGGIPAPNWKPFDRQE